jgi:hypothetical protein
MYANTCIPPNKKEQAESIFCLLFEVVVDLYRGSSVFVLSKARMIVRIDATCSGDARCVIGSRYPCLELIDSASCGTIKIGHELRPSPFTISTADSRVA